MDTVAVTYVDSSENDIKFLDWADSSGFGFTIWGLYEFQGPFYEGAVLCWRPGKGPGFQLAA